MVGGGLGGCCSRSESAPNAMSTGGTDAGTAAGGAGHSEPVDAAAAADSVDKAYSDARRAWLVPGPKKLGKSRKAELFLPQSYDGTKALPVIFLLGGYDYLAADLDTWLQLSKRVNGREFALVLPDGNVDSEGSPFWNATPSCCDYDDTKVDDAGWLLSLLDELEAKVHTDTKRVALIGHSAGGFMAYRLACDAPTRFSAVVSVAGSGFVDASACKASAPVSVLQVHGVQGETMPYAGEDGIPGALGITARWGERAGCKPESWGKTGVAFEHADDGVAAETVEFSFQQGCDSGVAVVLWRMEGNDHYPEFRPVFTDNLLSWALAKARP